MQLPTWTWDLLGLVGLALVTTGFALAWFPFVFILPGVAILAVSFLGARHVSHHPAKSEPQGGDAGKPPVQPQ